MSAEADDEEFLPPGLFLLPAPRDNFEPAAEPFSFLDNLEADLHADVVAGRAFLKQISPKSESSDDLLVNSSVLRSVLQDKSIRVSKENQSFFNNRKQQENEDVKRLRAEKEKLVNELQKLELDLSLEKHEKRTVIESLEREKQIFMRCLEEEKMKSTRTLQRLQSELESNCKEHSKSIVSLNKQVQDLEAQRQVLLDDAKKQQETDASALATKLQEIRMSLDEKHSAESQVLVNEMNALRIAKEQAETEAAKYKRMLDNKRADLSATIRSLQRRMGAFEQERDEFEQAYIDEHKKFEETYRELLDCQRLRNDLLEAAKSFDIHTVDLKSTIQQLESKLNEQQTIIEELRRHATEKSNSVSDEGLQAEVDFLHEALDQEIQRNGLNIQTLRSELATTVEALEQERSRNAELGAALDQEELCASELEQALEQVDRYAQELVNLRNELADYKKRSLEEETKAHRALEQHKTCLVELEEAKQRLHDSNDAAMKLSESVMQLKGQVQALRKRFRDEAFENTRIARDALDTVNTMFKERFDRQNAMLKEKENQLDVLSRENERLTNELHETLEDLDLVLDIKEESDDIVKELTMKIQELQCQHQAALLKCKQDYDLMEEDLLDALEREDEAQQAHEAVMSIQQECLAKSTERHQEAMEKVTALRAEVEILNDKNIDSVYSVMDLTDLFRSCQIYFSKDFVGTNAPECQGQSDAMNLKEAPDLSAVANDGSDPSMLHTSLDCLSTSSELMIHGSASASSLKDDETDLFQTIGSFIPSSTVIQVFRDIVVTKSSDIPTVPSSDISSEASFLQGQDDLKPSPSTAFIVKAAKPIVEENQLESKHEIDDDQSSSASECFTGKIEQSSTCNRARVAKPRSSLPAPPRTITSQSGQKLRIQPLQESKVPSAIPRASNSSKKPSCLSGIPSSFADQRDRKTTQKSGRPRASDRLTKRASLSTTPSSAIGRSLTSTTMLSSASRQGMSNLSCSKKRSHLPSYDARRSSMAGSSRGSLLQRQQGSRSNFSTPNKDDLSKKFDRLSTLSNLKLRSGNASTSAIAPKGASYNQSYRSAERKPASRPSGITPPQASRVLLSTQMPEATPLKFRDEIVEIVSPESPLLTPAKRATRLNVSPQVVKIQAVWRRYQALQRFCNERQAAIKVQALCRMHIMRAERRCHRSACIRIQSVYRVIIAKRQRAKVQLAMRTIVRWAHSRLVSKRNRREARRLETINEAAALARQKDEQKHVTAVLVVQSFLRMAATRLIYTRMRHASVMLQSLYRRRYQKFVVKASTIQLFWRSRALRCRFTKVREAAISIQALARGATERSRQKIRQSAAIVIQASLRRAAARVFRHIYLVACLKLQSFVRCQHHRSVFRRYRAAVTSIQMHWRQRYAARSARAAAIRIQANWRGRHQFRRCLRLRIASRTIQAFIFFRYTAIKKRQKATRSSSIIQSNFRRYQARSKYKKFITACSLIQAFARDHAKREFQAKLIQKTWRRFQLKHIMRKEKAATTLQCHYRRYLEREAPKRRSFEASRIIQAAFRRHQIFERSRKRREAACILIQMMQRRQHAKKERKKLIVLKQKVTKIQATFRMKSDQIRLASLSAACISIQRMYRDHQNSLLIKRTVAATKVQAWLRCGTASRQFREVRSSSVIVQAWFKSLTCRRRFKVLRLAAQMIAHHVKTWFRRCAMRKIASANVIQANIRRYWTRTHYLLSKNGCIVIQAFWRRRSHEIAFRSFARCVVLLQSITRGNSQRRLLKRRRKAATAIQSRFRMLQHHDAYIELYSSVLTIQSFHRMIAARMLLEKHKSARLIQTTIRVFIAKSKYCKTSARIVMVQSVVRRNAARSHFHRARSASVSLQSVARMRLTRVTNKRIRETSTSTETPRSLRVLPLRRNGDNVSPGLRDQEICRTRRSKRLRSEMTASSPANRTRETLGDEKGNSRLAFDGEHIIPASDSKVSSGDDGDTRRSEIEKLKVTELRRQLQQMGVEGKLYNKLRKAQLVEMVLEHTYSDL